MDAADRQNEGKPAWPVGRVSLPHRGKTRMEVGEPARVGGTRPWLCIVRLLGPPAEEPDGDPTQTLLVSTGRGATPDKARRDAIARLALIYGSPVGPAPAARISTFSPAPGDDRAALRRTRS